MLHGSHQKSAPAEGVEACWLLFLFHWDIKNNEPIPLWNPVLILRLRLFAVSPTFVMFLLSTSFGDLVPQHLLWNLAMKSCNCLTKFGTWSTVSGCEANVQQYAINNVQNPALKFHPCTADMSAANEVKPCKALKTVELAAERSRPWESDANLYNMDRQCSNQRSDQPLL